MKFPYQQNDSGQSFPIVPLRLSKDEKFLSTIALIDSGATISIFQPAIAKYFNIDIETGKEIFLGGVGGRIKGYIHEVDVSVGGQNFILPIVFSQEYHVSFNLLGRNTFFENFLVTFDEKNKQIELKK